MIRNGRHSDVGPPPGHPMRMGPTFSISPDCSMSTSECCLRVCQLAHLSRRDHRVWSWEACRADHGLCHHTDGTHTQRSHGNEAPALRSQLLGASCGRQLGQVTGPAGRTRGSKRSARTRLW